MEKWTNLILALADFTVALFALLEFVKGWIC